MKCILYKGPLSFCSMDRNEALYKLHQNDYKKSNKTASYNQFILENESQKLVIEQFESALPSNEIYLGNKEILRPISITILKTMSMIITMIKMLIITIPSTILMILDQPKKILQLCFKYQAAPAKRFDLEEHVRMTLRILPNRVQLKLEEFND